VVYSSDGQPLTSADLRAVQEDARSFGDIASGRVIGPTPSDNGKAATVVVPVEAADGNDALESRVEDLRAEVADGLPDGLSGEVTGAAAFATDLGKVFEGADVRLLGATVLVVALLLLITYRSPFLWIVPLVVVGAGDQVAASAINILARAGVPVGDPSTSGIVSVLVFGAGTNYALLLVARYREALRQHEDRFVAMRAALRSAAPAIAASAGTVGVSLLMLLQATLPFNRAIGIAGALGIAIALLYGLVVLPAALVVFGRWLFWPFVPYAGTADPTKEGIWSRVADIVTRRPRRTLGAGFAVLALLALGLASVETGLSQTEQFRAEPESVQGQRTLDRYFESGASQPLTGHDRPIVGEERGGDRL
ncbi:MAG: MMPL family transporter, partial [Actinomycetia bacterium]|nr:MMPL family transporter [Actinomycetes bacterium]